MAKENCRHCGKEIGFTSQVKLIDGTFICRDCYKKAGEVFHNMVHGYAAYEQLLREQERNHMIYEKILNGQKKSEMFGATSAWYLYCYAGCGLMYFKTERGGFVANYFDECFGLGGKGFSGFKKAMQKNKQDVMAVAAMTQGIKSIMNGGDQAQAAETITSSAQFVMQGDRTEWIQKTEAALAGAGIDWNV